MNARKLARSIAIAAVLAASIAQADTLVIEWPDVTGTWTGTINRVYYDDDGDGHILFNADGEPIWTPTSLQVFAAGFDDAPWHALITLPPGNYWETVSGTCSYTTAGTLYKLVCQ